VLLALIGQSDFYFQKVTRTLEKGQDLLKEAENLDEEKIWQLIQKTTGITLAILESLEYKLIVLD
jgi:hypothetical protein